MQLQDAQQESSLHVETAVQIQDQNYDVYLCIGRYKAESFRDLCWGGATSNVEEIRRFTTMQFDNVHCGHRKTCSVHWHSSHMQYG